MRVTYVILSGMKIYYTEADRLSFYPVIQQAVGFATIVQNMGRIGEDILSHINDFSIHFFGKNPDNLTSKERADLAVDSILKRTNTTDHSDPDIKITCFNYRDGIEPNILRRITYIGIGIIRMTPVLGTLWSCAADCTLEHSY